MPAPYSPERGDAIWLEFDPQAGREQSGRRPALVLSPASYNRKSGLAVVCSITSRQKGYTFESIIPGGLAIQGVVLSDQVRNMDWRVRKAKFIVRMPSVLVDDVTAKVAALLGIESD